MSPQSATNTHFPLGVPTVAQSGSSVSGTGTGWCMTVGGGVDSGLGVSGLGVSRLGVSGLGVSRLGVSGLGVLKVAFG